MEQGQLLRIRLDGDDWVFGSKGTGRSLYLCSSPACADQLSKKGRASRALRVPIQQDQLERLRLGLQSQGR